MRKYFIIIIFIFLNSDLLSQNWDLTQKIVAPIRDIGNAFGNSVAIEGDFAVVGSYNGTDENNMNLVVGAGAAYIFEKNSSGNWVFIQKIVASDRTEPTSVNGFGEYVAISGNTIVVGRITGSSGGPGSSIYIFERDTNGVWQETQILSTEGRDNSFGVSVDISGDYIIVGANKDRIDNSQASREGTAFIFERDTNGVWQEVERIYASDPNNQDQFGLSVAISGDYAVVGAYLDDEDENGINTVNAAGSAYIFERDATGSWTEVQKIVEPSNREASDFFGHQVAIDGTRIVIGTFGEDTDANNTNPGVNTGAVFVFDRNPSGLWTFSQKLTATVRSSSDDFGFSVSVSGDFICVGADGTDNAAGAAYIFSRDANNDIWSEQQRLIAPVRLTNDQFGNWVSIQGGTVLIGAWFEDDDENEMNFIDRAGSAYFFEFNGNLSIEDLNQANLVSIYPNPTLSSLYFKTSNNVINKVKLFSIQGQLVKYVESESIEEINIDDLPNGLYILKAFEIDNNQSTFKVLKQ